ncbi:MULTISPECIES: S1 family peptidase [Pseudomonas]|uniref:S1 family peptidase n=1 Tax=Pseudomonas TaxID=286 RepID=UPI000A7C53AB|nr:MULTISPECIES: serine protease [Pseudomonas]
MNKLSAATTYLQTSFVNAATDELIPRGYGTGFFTRKNGELFLVTNWHIVSGIDPSKPEMIGELPPPHLLKITAISKKNTLSEITCPLYDSEMNPIWLEHKMGGKVDIAVYPLPDSIQDHFHIFEIEKFAESEIDEAVGKDAFILGYPFSHVELTEAFGQSTPYYLPVWKRASIATEPSHRLADRVILLDSLSRPGMSGAPVLISEDKAVVKFPNREAYAAAKRLADGDLSALAGFDTSSMKHGTERAFKLLGIYSGVIGDTKLAQTALGRCWHVDAIEETLTHQKNGEMPFHAPVSTPAYQKLLKQCSGQLIMKDKNGDITKKIELNK